MQPLRELDSRFVVLDVDNVDTDQIIPARFLTGTSRDGIGDGLFADWRYDEDGRPRPDFVLNRADARGADVLVAGRNFGCGSSREHAAWALRDNGIRCVISSEIADIFRTNALKNGVLPVVLPAAVHQRLVRKGTGSIAISVVEQTVRHAGIEASFPLDPFARRCLIEGVDELGYLLGRSAEIDAFEATRASAGPR